MAYNYWAILGLDVFAIVFWIVAFALLASEVAPFSTVTPSCLYYLYGFCVSKKRDIGLAKRNFSLVTYRNVLAAAAGLGGLEL